MCYRYSSSQDCQTNTRYQVPEVLCQNNIFDELMQNLQWLLSVNAQYCSRAAARGEELDDLGSGPLAGKYLSCWRVPEQDSESSPLTSVICQLYDPWKCANTLWSEIFCKCSTGWFLSSSSEVPLDALVFNLAKLCIFPQSVSKGRSMRPYTQMLHWSVGVMGHTEAPCHWLLQRDVVKDGWGTKSLAVISTLSFSALGHSARKARGMRLQRLSSTTLPLHKPQEQSSTDKAEKPWTLRVCVCVCA